MKPRWKITNEAFERLLKWLSPNQDDAGKRYEELRRKLIGFFVYRGSGFPEDLADQTLDRVAEVLETRETELEAGPVAFTLGVARNIYRESLKEKTKFPPESVSPAGEDKEDDFRCLDECLEKLPAEARELICRYYQHDGSEKIKARQRLAGELKIKVNALRLRASRIREQLSGCHEKCMENKDRVKPEN
jgi:DNA-directed RNA polymerase specialized sigma24 family protein